MTDPKVDTLTIDRLFDAPALAGPALLGLQWSPDGARITFLRGKSDEKDRLDLWEYDLHNQRARVLVDSLIFDSGRENLLEEELNRRERARTAGLSGILEYSFAPAGNWLLFLVGGQVYHYDLIARPAEALTAITRYPEFVTDARVSPKGAYVAYVRGQNLYACDLATRTERALTRDGGGAIKNGMAEFVAQEEMGRATGYWCSPDDAHIAFARVDETSVKMSPRFEIFADNLTTFSQRYPVAGDANAVVRLGVVDVSSGAMTWIDLGSDGDFYLARVDWLPDAATLAVQRQSRDQRRLDLLFADIKTGTCRVVLSEASDSCVELNDELTFLKQSPEFVWASARDGFTHLYLYGMDGSEIRRLTEGSWPVDDFRGRAIKGVDEDRRKIYFTAATTPAERQLFQTSLDAPDACTLTQITREAGIHDITMPRDAQVYIDLFSSTEQPPRVSLNAIDGALMFYMEENRLDEMHPSARYLAGNSLTEFGTLCAADGQVLHYKISKPRNFDPTRHYPVIVEVYGGPGVQRVVNRWGGDAFTQILTRAGYVVFQLDNRGSASRGTRFQSPIHGQLGDVEVADQVVGAKWLASQPYIDSSRIGVWGWSYGGYLTLMLMFKAPDVFRAGVSGAPVTDWTLYDTHYTERYLGRPQDNPDGYAASSVLPYASDLKGRLLLIHGMADDNVLFLHSTKLIRRLQDLGKPFDVMVYPGAKHGLLRQQDGRHAYTTIKEFFDRNLSLP